MKRGYQANYWRNWESCKDLRLRGRKAQKIRAILEDAMPRIQEEEGWGLDIGCSIAVISEHLARRWRRWRLIGVDIDEEALRLAQDRGVLRYLYLCLGDATRLPFPSDAFDWVVCAQVYEHVSDWRALLKEAYRVLRPGGVCFFSGPNRFALVEAHYGLPLLSWVPRRLAHRIVRWSGKAPFYYEHPVSWWTLKRTIRACGFEIRDYTYRLVEEPERFYMYGFSVYVFSKLIRIIPSRFRRWLTPLLPNFNLVLRKPA